MKLSPLDKFIVSDPRDFEEERDEHIEATKIKKSKFKTVKYDITRTSTHEYTHAVIFINITKEEPKYAATFRKNIELAIAEAKQIEKMSHLKFIEIVPVEKVTQ